ncbi:hypothetical protein [Tepidibacillus sp. LV47]|uniref:hypothetical protein n=1 Tax=Tepidibacillus sp. LV47 TaxID=3398228 RepID=UPI003AB053D3
MEKAELLEEIRCELGLLLKNVQDKKEWYDTVIHLLKSRIDNYQSIFVYLTDETSFYYYTHLSDEKEIYQEKIYFGDEMLSIVAARGEISCEFIPGGQKIYIPFYRGHHLLGEMIITTSQFVDTDELKFMKNIQTILSAAPF